MTVQNLRMPASVREHGVNDDQDVQFSEEYSPFIDAETQRQYVVHHSFTLRAVLAGLVIGVLVNLSNMYYGLQTGNSNQMSMVSALLGYIGFKVISKHLSFHSLLPRMFLFRLSPL